MKYQGLFARKGPDLPIPVTEELPVETRSRLLVDWTVSLLAGSDLQKALVTACRELGANSARLTRLDHRTGAARTVATTRRDRIAPAEPRSFALPILGAHATAAVAGSLWPMSESPAVEELAALARDFAVREVLAVPLETGPRTTDVLELRFGAPPGEALLKRLAPLAAALAYAWSKRRAGTVLSLLAQPGLRAIDSDPARPVPIMDPSNPASLTRAELRVCMLLRKGLRARTISEELGLSESTVRSHLRNLYQKTGATGNLELMSLLAAEPEGTPLAEHERGVVLTVGESRPPRAKSQIGLIRPD